MALRVSLRWNSPPTRTTAAPRRSSPGRRRDTLLGRRQAGWLQTHPWSTVLIPGFAERDPLPEWMTRRIAYRGKGVVFDYRRVPASWEALVASLNKSMRDNVRYYPRLMQRRGQPYVFDVASTPAEISATLPLLFNLHRERAEATMRIAHDDYFDHPNRRALRPQG